MDNAKALFEIIVRIGYNIPGITDQARLEFSQFINFHFANKISAEQRQHIENTMAVRDLASVDDLKSLTSSFSKKDKIRIISALKVLQGQAEKSNDSTFTGKIRERIKEITSLLELDDSAEEIRSERSQWESEVDRYKNRPLVTIPVLIWPLVIDYLVRWVFLIVLGSTGNTSYLIIVNTYFTVLWLALIYLIGRRYRQRNEVLLKPFGGESAVQLDFRLHSGQYTLLAFTLGSGILISYFLREPLHGFALAGLPMYYLIYLRLYPLWQLNENMLAIQIEKGQVSNRRLDRDENDEVLVGLETRLNSLTGRLEAYVLESALFGALTFSGFLQIMSSELVTFESLDSFAQAIFQTARAFVQLDGAGVGEGMTLLNTKVNLFCLVSVESLLCSVLFLGVIATRLRFSNIADQVRQSLNLATALNEKEEAQYDLGSNAALARQSLLTQKVNDQLHYAEQSMQQLQPVMDYMQYFRNAGILTFLLILLSSTLFITSVLGWTFLILVIATLIYFNWGHIQLIWRATMLKNRMLFMSMSIWFFVLSITPFVIGFILENIFYVKNGYFNAFGWLLLGVYLFIWFLVGAHVDNEFGDIADQTSLTRLNRWRIVKGIMAVLVLLLCLAMVLKQLHKDGANMLLTISISAFSFNLFFVGYYLSKKWWMGIFGGWFLATAFIGWQFSILHLPGASDMVLIGLATTTILIPLFYWQRKRFHILFIRLLLVGWILSALLYLNVYAIIEVMVSHRTMDAAIIANVKLSRESEVDKPLHAMDQYIVKYGTSLGYTPVYKHAMGSYLDYALESSIKAHQAKDSILMQRALRVAQQAERIELLFDYRPVFINSDIIGIESAVWMEQNRPKEAVESLKRILANHPPESVVNQVRQEIMRIEEASKLLHQ
jgi:hypothetical protein